MLQLLKKWRKEQDELRRNENVAKCEEKWIEMEDCGMQRRLLLRPIMAGVCIKFAELKRVPKFDVNNII